MNNDLPEKICSHNSRYVFNAEEYFDVVLIENIICAECQEFVGSKRHISGGSIFLEGLDANFSTPLKLIANLTGFKSI